MDLTSTSSETEQVDLASRMPTDEELDAILKKQDAGIELSEEEYDAIERAALGSYDDPAITLR